MAKLHFLITAGGTREYIDPVRFISNAGSGKMGRALAEAALKAGHKVTLITTAGNIQSKIQNPRLKARSRPPLGRHHPMVGQGRTKSRIIEVETAAQMFEEVKKNFNKCSCLIMTAAVSDYKPSKKSKIKIKRSKKDLVLRLKPTVDILKWAGRNKKKNQIIIGFALQDRDMRKNAEKKLKEKNLDMVIANSPSAIGAEKSKVEVKPADGKWIKLAEMKKSESAAAILKHINLCFER